MVLEVTITVVGDEKRLCVTVTEVEAEIVADPAVPFRKVRGYHPTTWLRVVLREGRKRQLRRMTAAVGLPCLRLVRVGIGPLVLGDLQPGQWREITEDERRRLMAALKMERG